MGLMAHDLRDVRFCALTIAVALIATKCVTLFATGIDAYALWGVIWTTAGSITTRQMWCSLLLFASGLCYLLGYIADFSVGPGTIASFTADGLGIAALLGLGGQIVGNLLGKNSLTDWLGNGYPRLMGND